MGASLAMGSNNDGPSLVVVIQVILKGGLDVLICEVKCLFSSLRIRGEIGNDIGLAVSGRKYAAFVENTSLI